MFLSCPFLSHSPFLLLCLLFPCLYPYLICKLPLSHFHLFIISLSLSLFPIFTVSYFIFSPFQQSSTFFLSLYLFNTFSSYIQISLPLVPPLTPTQPPFFSLSYTILPKEAQIDYNDPHNTNIMWLQGSHRGNMTLKDNPRKYRVNLHPSTEESIPPAPPTSPPPPPIVKVNLHVHLYFHLQLFIVLVLVLASSANGK